MLNKIIKHQLIKLFLGIALFCGLAYGVFYFRRYQCIQRAHHQQGLDAQARAHGFVYLHEVDPTIIVSPRYATSENFLGRPVTGYKKPVIMLTQQAAEALKRVQESVAKDGYSLVVYDAYRPQQAVDDFKQWSETGDNAQKARYYPRVDKKDFLELHYVATKRSGHSRGSTIDLTLIKKDTPLHEVVLKERTLRDGFVIPVLDDGTVDMGSSFDLFDEVSHPESDLIEPEFTERRMYLKDAMERENFKNHFSEWWHFTLKDEPYPADEDSSYFNFEVQ